jgi:pimeloyl-ACP methyl ester carboxylesterase
MSTFALVHGAWHDAGSWELLVPELESRGHTVIAPDLPCDDVDAGFADYARVTTEALAGSDPPILVGHSLGGDTIPLVAAERPVALLVYLCPLLHGFARPAGQEAPRRVQPWPHRPHEWQGGGNVWDPEQAIETLYPRLDRPLAERMAARLRPQADVFSAPYPLPEPPALPSAMVVARDDELFRPEWSRWMARTVLGVEPIEVDGGHFQQLEWPRQLAELLDTLALRA